ncbi:DUF1801 domain-containing protein [Streptomyces sp. A7024]|uniref:DUF1801 domain-containing protein n=1 Tax=Streptomyces coryli TaxID=1128680 RepID=A0A6G4TWY4_9ACTN|nr:DUF1801 domain-containing protein [Streptomyces coryli]NGN64394.1 DUF1801 domain-containing protein [Streptomyces coryli]
MREDVAEIFAARDPAIAALGRSTYERLLALFPEAVVTVDGNDIGFGTDAGYRGLVFTLSPAKAHVTLGIAGGASLPDPAGLLQGTGKVHRHVKLHATADLERPELTELLRAALASKGATRP